MKTIKPILSLNITLIIIFLSSCASIDELIKEGKFAKAEKYCEKQRGEEQIECFRILAKTFFDEANLFKAGVYYEKAKDKNGLKIIADVFYSAKDYDNAGEYYEKSENEDGLKRIADVYFSQGFYEKSGYYYEKANNKNGLKNVADALFSKENYKAIIYYEKANIKEMVDKCEAIINPKSGKWEGTVTYIYKEAIGKGNISFIISNDGKTITQLEAEIPFLFSLYEEEYYKKIKFKAKNDIPIIRGSFSYENYFTFASDSAFIKDGNNFLLLKDSDNLFWGKGFNLIFGGRFEYKDKVSGFFLFTGLLVSLYKVSYDNSYSVDRDLLSDRSDWDAHPE